MGTSPLYQILRVLGENAIAVRTKAMKCLSEVVAVDPSILARVSFAFCSPEKPCLLIVGTS